MSDTRVSPGWRDQLAALGIDHRDLARAQMNTATANVTDVEDITVPDSAEGLEEMLNDAARMSRLLAQGGTEKLSEVIRRYAKNVLGKDMDMAKQVRELSQQALNEFLRDAAEDGAVPRGVNFGNATGLAAGLQNQTNDRMARAGLFEARAMGARINDEFPTNRSGVAEFFRLCWHAAQRDSAAQAKLGRIRAAFSSEVPSDGGFLIPENLRSELLRTALETGIARSRSRVIPMESLRVPFPAVEDTDHTTSVYGGVVAYWTEEGAALTESSASFGRVVLDAKKLTAYTEVPNELLADSILSFEAFINDIFPEALSWYEDLAFLKGSGVGEPLGILDTDNGALITVAQEVGQSASTIVWENCINMFARLLPTSMMRAVWLAPSDALPQLATMALTVGTGGSAVWLSNGVDGPPVTILGRPVIFTEKTPGTLGEAGVLSLVDFSYYLIGDRQAMSAMSSPHFKFSSDKTAYRIIERVDGRPWLQSPITPQNGGNTLSPFVQLGAVTG